MGMESVAYKDSKRAWYITVYILGGDQWSTAISYKVFF